MGDSHIGLYYEGGSNTAASGGGGGGSKTGLYSFLPPGWDTGAPVEQLRRNPVVEPTASFEEVSEHHGFHHSAETEDSDPEPSHHEYKTTTSDSEDFSPQTSPTDPSSELKDVSIEESKNKEDQGWIMPPETKTEENKKEKGKTKATTTVPEEEDKVETADTISITGDEEQKVVITVGDYQKHGEGMGSYIAYKLHVKTTLPQYHKSEFTAERRYNDFFWLHEKLRENFKGYITPPMPDKTVIQNRFDTQFIEKRRRELAKFVKRVAEHPVLSASEQFQTFLESDSEELVVAKSKKPQPGVTKKMFSWMSSTVSSSISPANEVDGWYETKRAYLLDLEAKLEALLKASEATVGKLKEVVSAEYELSLKCSATAATEEPVSGLLARHMTKLGDVFDQVRSLRQEAIGHQEERLDETIADHLRVIAAAKEAVAARLTALAIYQQCERVSAAKRERKEKMAGTPKSAAAETEWDEAEKRLEAAKQEYETVSKALKRELERFERSKAREIRAAILELAKANMDTTVQIADQWKKLLNQIQSTEEEAATSSS